MPTFTLSPARIAHGSGGVVTCGALVVGRLGEWEVVVSPTTGKPTLKGVGAFRRFWTLQPPASAAVRLQPATPPPTLRQPRPKAPPPFTLIGGVARLTAGAITIANGEADRPL